MANFQNATLASFNTTLLNDTSLCTLQTCPLVLDGVPLAHLSYLPSVAGNALYAGIFGLFFCLQVLFGVRYRTVGYLIGMFCGLLLEIVGYVGRVMMNSDPFINANFIMYLCCLTIAPAFLTASIYLCLSRIVVIYSESAARFKPKTYTLFFIVCDIISLTLQGAGGGVAATATTPSMDTTGKDLLIAGLAFQVVSLSCFATVCFDLYLAYRKLSDDQLNQSFGLMRSTWKFRAFLWTLAGATFFIFVRSCYRCAELSQGFHSSLANSEITFMILEGVMIVLATFLLTALHPGLAMRRDGWAAADWNAGRQKSSKPRRGRWFWSKSKREKGLEPKIEEKSSEELPRSYGMQC